MKILSKRTRRTLLLSSVLAGCLTLVQSFYNQAVSQTDPNDPCVYHSRHGEPGGPHEGACLGTGGDCPARICD
jgi:hypothetical protein